MIDPLRVWAGKLPDVDIDDRRIRLGLNPIVRAHLDNRYSSEDHATRYGSLGVRYEIVESPTDAEVALYPFIIETRPRADFVSFLRTAESHHLRTLVFGGADLEPVMPSVSVILLHPGPTRGAQPHAQALALPYVFTDRARRDETRPDRERPSVAFCGQGDTRPVARAAQFLERSALHVTNRIHPQVVPPPISGHVSLRATALDRLRGHPGIDDHFVIRDRYRAGVSGDAERARTQREFDDNLRSSTYALCVRGTGNFSARFYEALSFGRVPLFVNTDCVLPLEDVVDWDRRCVWIEADDVDAIGNQLVEAHREVLHDVSRSQTALREVWETYLTQDGYFRHLVETIRSLL